MAQLTLEGFVEHGQIRLKNQVHLPDKTKVYVIVPETGDRRLLRITSPRLVNAEQASDFVLEVIEDGPNAGL